jgi:hypothetical protein
MIGNAFDPIFLQTIEKYKQQEYRWHIIESPARGLADPCKAFLLSRMVDEHEFSKFQIVIITLMATRMTAKGEGCCSYLVKGCV